MFRGTYMRMRLFCLVSACSFIVEILINISLKRGYDVLVQGAPPLGICIYVLCISQ